MTGKAREVEQSIMATEVLGKRFAGIMNNIT
jgi:hypothetical protein